MAILIFPSGSVGEIEPIVKIGMKGMKGNGQLQDTWNLPFSTYVWLCCITYTSPTVNQSIATPA